MVYNCPIKELSKFSRRETKIAKDAEIRVISNHGSFFLFFLTYQDLRRKIKRTRGLLTSHIPSRPPRSLRLGENKFEWIFIRKSWVQDPPSIILSYFLFSSSSSLILSFCFLISSSRICFRNSSSLFLSFWNLPLWVRAIATIGIAKVPAIAIKPSKKPIFPYPKTFLIVSSYIAMYSAADFFQEKSFFMPRRRMASICGLRL